MNLVLDKLNSYLLAILIIICAVLFIQTTNYIESNSTSQIPTTISAYNG